MTATQTLRLYELTSEFIKDKDKAKEYVARIEEAVDNKFESKKSDLATKEDLAIVRKEIIESKVDIIKRMVGIAIAIVSLIVGFVKLL